MLQSNPNFLVVLLLLFKTQLIKEIKTDEFFRCSSHCHHIDYTVWETIQNCLQFKNQLLSSINHIYSLSTLKLHRLNQEWFTVFSTTMWNFDVSIKIGGAFREYLNADIFCSAAEAENLWKKTHTHTVNKIAYFFKIPNHSSCIHTYMYIYMYIFVNME